MITVDVRSTLNAENVFVLASQANQVYYVRSISNAKSPWYTVLTTKSHFVNEEVASKKNSLSNDDALQNDISNASSSHVEPVIIHDPKNFFIDLRVIENDYSVDDFNEENNNNEDEVMSVDEEIEAREGVAAKEMFKSCWLLLLFVILMAAGASGSGSAMSRVTGNRGGGARNKVRGRSQGGGLGRRTENVGRDNQENYEEDQGWVDIEDNGDEGEEEDNDEEQLTVSDIRFGRAARRVCEGDYKKKPKLGEPKLGVVNFRNKKKESHYKKTLKAIVRTRWRFDTAKQKARAREIFLNECIEEFKEFYEYPPEYRGDKIKELEGDAIVRKHLKANIKCYMNGWKSDGLRRVEEAYKKGGMTANLRNCPPYYLSEQAWNGLVDYWETEVFTKLSKNGKENVKQSEIKHCTGAKPFDQRYEELEEKLEKPLTILEKFNASYMKNGKVEEIRRKLTVTYQDQKTMFAKENYEVSVCVSLY
ncbi:hypothetical protein AgCh_004908 [Apium graveolens]